MFRLKPLILMNDWGKCGTSGMVAKLARADDITFKYQSNKHYSELWVGSTTLHSCSIRGGRFKDQPLAHYLKGSPSMTSPLFKEIFQQYNSCLPFTMSVMSLGKASPLQVHPDQNQALVLHSSHRKECPDKLHKAKVIVAVTEIEMLCGFLPKPEIVKNLKEIMHLQNIIGRRLIARYFKANTLVDDELALKDCLVALFSNDPGDTSVELISLIKTLIDEEEKGKTNPFKKVLFTLHAQYPGDPAVFMVYFMNRFTLKPGEAVYIKPCNLHSVLKGDYVECSTSSHNALVAGFVQKPTDAATVFSTADLLGQVGGKEYYQLTPSKPDKHVQLFRPPVPDFVVARAMIYSDPGRQVLPAIKSSPSFAVVVSGSGGVYTSSTSNLSDGSLNDGHMTILSAGTVIFMEASQELVFRINDREVLLFRVYYDVDPKCLEMSGKPVETETPDMQSLTGLEPTDEDLTHEDDLKDYPVMHALEAQVGVDQLGAHAAMLTTQPSTADMYDHTNLVSSPTTVTAKPRSTTKLSSKP